MIKDKFFTKEQLKKVTELASSLSSDWIAAKFNMNPARFSKLKKMQPALQEAYNKGKEIRRLKEKDEKAKSKKEQKKDLIKMPTLEVERNNTLQDLDALNNFKKKFKQDRDKELKRELNNMYNILL